MAVDPVKEILATSGSVQRTSPTAGVVSLEHGTTLKTPGGTPAFSASCRTTSQRRKQEQRGGRLTSWRPDLGQSESRQRRVLGRLHHHRAAGGQSCCRLPADHRTGEVPLWSSSYNQLKPPFISEDEPCRKQELSASSRLMTANMLIGFLMFSHVRRRGPSEDIWGK